MRIFAKFSMLIFASSLIASAALIPISGYDINDAALSGHGGWAHTYAGTITNGLNFQQDSFAGTLATYSGVGTGTLTDGVIGASTSNSQLFVAAPETSDQVPVNPSIFLTLPIAYFVDTIEIFGGPENNAIPGSITALTVQLFGPSGLSAVVGFNPVGFGALNAQIVPINDRISLAGSGLENFAAYTVILSGFVSGNPNFGGWFSITEITLDGREAGDTGVPEPGALGLTATGLLAALWLRRK